MPGTAIVSFNDLKARILQTELKIEHTRNLLHLYSQNTNLGYIGSQVNAKNISVQEENLRILHNKLNYWNHCKEEYIRKNPDKETYFEKQ